MPETINSIAASARHTGAEARFGLKPRGFTLIEVLVALSIMAVMAALTWRGIDGMARAQAATQRYTDDVLTLQAGLTQWRADLDAMMVWPTTAPAPTVTGAISEVFVPMKALSPIVVRCLFTPS